jgi:hypothetical protein
MPTPDRERARKSRLARVAKGERRLVCYLDAETVALLDAYIEQCGLEKKETVRQAIRRFVSEQQERTAA